MSTPTNQLLNVCEEDLDLFSYQGCVTQVKVTSVYDGDTFTGCFIDDGVLKKYKFRCAGYDSAELRQARNAPNREQAKARARDDRQHFIDLVDRHSGGTQVLECLLDKFDKYGRILIHLPVDGTINREMVASGHGYVYDGGTKQQ